MRRFARAARSRGPREASCMACSCLGLSRSFRHQRGGGGFRGRRRLRHVAGVERRLRVVLHRQLDDLGAALAADLPASHSARSIPADTRRHDSFRHPSRHDPLIADRLHTQSLQCGQGHPVRRGAFALQQPGRGQDHRARAHRRRPHRGLVARRTQSSRTSSRACSIVEPPGTRITSGEGVSAKECVAPMTKTPESAVIGPGLMPDQPNLGVRQVAQHLVGPDEVQRGESGIRTIAICIAVVLLIKRPIIKRRPCGTDRAKYPCGE